MNSEEHEKLHEDSDLYKKWKRVYLDAMAVADLAKEHMRKIDVEHRTQTDS